MKKNIFSICSDDEDEDDDVSEVGIDDIMSNGSTSTVVRMLEKLKASPSKKRVK